MQLHCARLDQKRWGGVKCPWQEKWNGKTELNCCPVRLSQSSRL